MDSTVLNELLAKKGEIEKTLSRLDVGLLVFGAIVAGALALETFLGIRHWSKNRELQTIEQKIDTENDRRHEADIGGLTDQLTDARNETKVAAQTIATLSYRIGRRELKPETRRAMFAALSTFRNQRYQIIPLISNDSDASMLAEDISHVLESCDWTFAPSGPPYPQIPATNTMAGGVSNFTDGLLLFTNAEDDATESFRNAVNTLARILPIGFQSKSNDVSRGIILIVVPPKPPDPDTLRKMGEEGLKPGPLGPEITDPIWMSLTAYEGQRVSVYTPFNNEDADAWLKGIVPMLFMARWKIVNLDNPGGVHLDYNATFGNILVGVGETEKTTGKTFVAATALLEKFKGSGIADQSSQLARIPGLPDGEVTIRIGYQPALLKKP